MNILLLAVSAGGGHQKAAEAVKEYVQAKYPSYQTKIVDAYRYVSPILDKVVIGSYLKTLKNSPKLWGKIYELAEKGENVNDISQTINRIFSFKIKKLVKDFKPDIIICTHPFPLHMVCNLKKNGTINIPILNIITDYATHSLWVNEYVDAYVVAHDMLVHEMVERGVQKDKILPFGIPICNSFLSPRERSSIINDFGLQDKSTFLLMGGSLGLGEIKKLFIKLLESPRDFQIVIVCGKNLKLKKQLEKIYTNYTSSKKVVILGFTYKVHELMSISDLIITKPGGLTITESLLMKLPIVIISPIPGQEEKNAAFLLNNGAGIRLNDVNEINRVLSQYIDNPLRIKHIKEMSEYLAKPNSTKDLVEYLNNLKNKILLS